MHISDGVISSLPLLAGASAVAAAGVGFGLRKIDPEQVPRVGLLAAVFFVASLIHVPIGPASAHLLVIGLTGLLLGWAAFPAVAVALFLQALLFGFGGLTVLGVNTLNMALPAVLCYHLFGRAIGRSASARGRFALGFLAGAAGIAFACAMTAATLIAAGREFVVVAQLIAVAHVPVMVIEGAITASAVGFLHQVRPELLPFSARHS